MRTLFPVELRPEVEALIAAQDGLLHREQAYECGMSRAKLRWWISRGYWRAALPAVYATFPGALSPSQRLLAASLYAGVDAQVTGPAALRLYGLRTAPVDGLVCVLVPHRRQRPPVGWVRVSRTRRLDPHPLSVGPLVVASLPRAVVDTARACPEQAVQELLTEVVLQRFCTPAQVRTELLAGPRQHSALVRRLLDDLEAVRGPSAPAYLRPLFAASEILPPVLWDAGLSAPDGRSVPAPDGWIPEVDLGIVIDQTGSEAAPAWLKATLKNLPADWASGVSFGAGLARHGAEVLHFTTAQVLADPARVLRRVEEAYLRRLRRGVRGRLTATRPP